MYVIVTDRKAIANFAESLGVRVIQINSDGKGTCNGEIAIDQELPDKFLNLLAIPPYLRGYKYIRRLFEYYIEEEDGWYLSHVTKELYPMLAEQFEATPAGIERTIRYAIGYGFKRAPGRYEEIFGRAMETRPANKDFFAAMYTNIRNYIKRQSGEAYEPKK